MEVFPLDVARWERRGHTRGWDLRERAVPSDLL